ncbi:hypothetical protein BJX99DRAFT_238099 [Aspergillus californicus]
MDSYGYGGGGGGGGFMPGEMNGSPSGGKSDLNNNTIRPITIKQALDAAQPYPDASYQIDNQDVSHIVFVGQVRNISSQATNITYKLDDGTGEIEAKMWVNPTDDMDMTEDIEKDGKDRNGVEVNGYAKVYGKIKALMGNRKVINTHCVRPLTDINELHFHFLEAAAVHLFFTRGPPPSAGGAGAGDASEVASGDAAMGGLDPNQPALTPAAKRVYNLLKTTPQTNEGLHAQVIAATLKLPMLDVARAGEELVSAGVVFSTVDDQTWAILEY